jgi:hypothetical protein
MEEHRLRVFEKWMLRRIFGLKKDKIERGWRKLHNELHISYAFPNIIRMFKSRRMGRALGARERKEECIQGFGEKARRKKTRKT